MKIFAVILLALVAIVSARHIALEDVIELENTYDYIQKIGIPLAKKIREAEEQGRLYQTRIVDGSFAALGQFPYQAGLVVHLPTGFQTFAGGVLVSPSRVFTAAHNLVNIQIAVSTLVVVLGSTTIFTGGTRITTNDFVLHENYNYIINDVAMINLPYAVQTSSIIAPIALPSGAQLNENFVGDVAIASGFGRTADINGVVANQQLSFVHLTVITNEQCARSLGNNIQTSNVCTQGEGIKNVCTGDSGGPLAVTRNNAPLLIGITSFGTPMCEDGAPSAYARVTSFINWINNRL